MVKKSSRSKKQRQTRRSWHFHFKRLYLLLFVCVLTFSVLSLIIREMTPIPTCANSKTCKTDLSEKIENNAIGIFEGKSVIAPSIANASTTPAVSVLGETATGGEKHIYVDLASQTLSAYEGTTLVLKTLISSGKWDKTPVGNFHIWEKLRSTRMAGGSGADAYDLPNVPYVMYFYQDFGLHGAYWHDNFGHPMSHGCVNMRAVDAQILFDWADGPTGDTPGTAVSVCDQITGTNQCIQTDPIQ